MNRKLKPINVKVKSVLPIEAEIIRGFILAEIQVWCRKNYPEMEFEVK